MTDDSLRDLKRREEHEQERRLDPAERWRLLQQMLTWIDAQAPVPRNSPARCLELQRAKLAFLETAGISSSPRALRQMPLTTGGDALDYISGLGRLLCLREVQPCGPPQLCSGRRRNHEDREPRSPG